MALKILIIYLVIINIIGFALMGIDKSKAKRGAWRISEKALFIPAILGGSLGANLGMQLFRHKTKHWYFVVFMPVLLIADIALLILLCVRFL